MNARVQAGLVQLAIGGGILFAWWTGAWEAIVESLAAGIRTSRAVASTTLAAPAGATSAPLRSAGGSLSGVQVAALARGAGFVGGALVTAVAVARAESGWRPGAVGDTALVNATWGPSIGLWQIRSLNADRGTGRPRDALRLTDPAFNARSAHTISDAGRNWGPWTVYRTGAYRQFLADAERAVAALTSRIPEGVGA